jgi:hypothetical protein
MFLASDDASYLPGTALLVDGGLMDWNESAPKLVNRTTGSFTSFICWTEDFITRRTKRDNVVPVPNRPIIR